MRSSDGKLNIARLGKLILVVELTLFPVIRLAYFILTTGVSTPSNDDVVYISVLDQVLSGTYLWKNFLHDTFLNGHTWTLPVLIEILTARFARWNVYLMLVFGLGLALWQLFLLQQAFSNRTKDPANYFLWPLLSALLFSATGVDPFAYPLTTLQIGLNHLGLFLGIWALVRFPGQWRGIGWMVLGGMIASFSWGSGVLTWPAFLFGLLLLGFRRWSHYLVWLGAFLISLCPYIYFLILEPTVHHDLNSESFLNFVYILKAIGWPFARNLASEGLEAKGLVGLILLAIGLGIFWEKRSKSYFVMAAPGWMLIAYSLLNMWQISIFRHGLVPWYSRHYMLFWIGLLDLAYVLWVHQKRDPAQAKPVWSMAVIAALLVFWGVSNWTFTDKTSFLNTRVPASASCLRHYKTAPTYCERMLFVWPPGQYSLMTELTEPLERHRLAVFAPRQRWTLQGDFILDNVTTQETPDIPDIIWTPDLDVIPAPFSDYRHLNLFLHSPNEVAWTLDLPAHLKSAEFHSAVAISRAAPYSKRSDGVRFEISVERSGAGRQIIFSKYLSQDQRDWVPFTIPLTQYAGEKVTLYLGSKMRGNFIHDWAMYRYPYVDLILDPAKTSIDREERRPSNTDLAFSSLKIKPEDYRFDLTDPTKWKTLGMTIAGKKQDLVAPWLIEGENPQMNYTAPLSLCLADYTHFYIKMAASKDILPRAMEVFFETKSSSKIERRVLIPLLPDEEVHTYTYDLKLLELEQKARLKGFRLDPVAKGISAESRVGISDLGFIGSDQPTRCLD